MSLIPRRKGPESGNSSPCYWCDTPTTRRDSVDDTHVCLKCSEVENTKATMTLTDEEFKEERRNKMRESQNG